MKLRMAGSDCEWQGMLNIGLRPTFDGRRKTIEVNIFNFSDDIYGRQVAVTFYAKIRDERKFRSAQELASQLEDDARRSIEILNR